MASEPTEKSKQAFYFLNSLLKIDIVFLCLQSRYTLLSHAFNPESILMKCKNIT